MNFKNLKYGAMFAAGFIASALSVYAAGTTTIETNLDNAVQYIKKIVLTDSVGNTGVILNYNGSGSSFFGGDLIFGDLPLPQGGDTQTTTMYSSKPFKIRSQDTINIGSYDFGAIDIDIMGIRATSSGNISLIQFGDKGMGHNRYIIDTNGEHHWYTSTGSDGKGIERMTIKDNGNVGIGNNNPQYPLHVDGSARVDGTFLANEARLNGAIIVGNDTTCNAGAIIFSGDTHFYGCNGSTWKQLDN